MNMHCVEYALIVIFNPFSKCPSFLNGLLLQQHLFSWQVSRRFQLKMTDIHPQHLFFLSLKSNGGIIIYNKRFAINMHGGHVGCLLRWFHTPMVHPCMLVISLLLKYTSIFQLSHGHGDGLQPLEFLKSERFSVKIKYFTPLYHLLNFFGSFLCHKHTCVFKG